MFQRSANVCGTIEGICLQFVYQIAREDMFLWFSFSSASSGTQIGKHNTGEGRIGREIQFHAV